MDRPSDVEVRTILRRTASITVIGAVASIAFSVSPAKAGTRGTIPPSWTDFLALAMPQPELSFAVHGQLHWYSHELCGFGDRVPVPAIVFSNQRGKVVGVIRPVRVTQYAQLAPPPPPPRGTTGGPYIVCARSARFSGTVRKAAVYEISVEGTLVDRISLASLREGGFELDVVVPSYESW